jgi:hypothetical protein
MPGDDNFQKSGSGTGVPMPYWYRRAMPVALAVPVVQATQGSMFDL